MSVLRWVLALGICLGTVGTACAQSNDGYHRIQIIPVAVDTTSFTQRFVFWPALPEDTSVSVRYYPADGTTQASPIDCPAFVIPGSKATQLLYPGKVFASLREICPALAAGSQFGFIYLANTGPKNQPFSGYSRVSNQQGIGFSVEAFPAHVFNSSPAVVQGLRRRAASGGSPAFQSNCFLATLGDTQAPFSTATSDIHFGLLAVNGSELGGGHLLLPPGRIVRLLDVFSSLGAPAGDYDNVSFRYHVDSGNAATMAFCTVQDNSSFGADFRIAKPDQDGTCLDECEDWGFGDSHYARDTRAGADRLIIGDAQRRAFSIPAGANHQNTHILRFRNPDWISCELINPATQTRALPAYGLEMRLVNSGSVLAGGNNVTGFDNFYLGDKPDQGGTNKAYHIQVESSETNEASARPYILHCQSGSGNTRGDTVRFDAAIDQF